jgi:hypothetical protein
MNLQEGQMIADISGMKPPKPVEREIEEFEDETSATLDD